MRKLMQLEVLVLAVLLFFSGALCVKISKEAVPAGPAAAVTKPTEDAVQTENSVPPETTEPEPTWMTFPADRALKGKQYFVYDCSQNAFLKKSGEGSERIYPASVTKLFTAYVAMQYVKPETEITAGDALDMVAWGSSVADIQKGDKLTADLLVEAMLLPSGNDAAYLLATEAGRVLSGNPQMSAKDAVAVFMTEMNKKAKEVGMTGSHFVNPDGIHDENHYTTFDDLVILGKLSMENPTVMKNAGTSRDVQDLASGKKEWKNTNALVDATAPFYCPYAIGLKTGQTPSAGSCLLSAFQKGDRKLIIGVFGCPKEEDRFEDTLQLFNEAVGIQ